MSVHPSKSSFRSHPILAPQAWGQSAELTHHNRFKVRHLIVRPGKSLDLQSHYHRSEHWLAVSGSGRVTIEGEVRDLYENHSVDIPAGQAHQLENHGKVDLHLIEVQTGAYLGDDDIIHHDVTHQTPNHIDSAFS